MKARKREERMPAGTCSTRRKAKMTFSKFQKADPQTLEPT